MKRYKVRFTPEAEDDLLRLDFLLEDDVALFEIESGKTIDVLALRHQRDDDCL